MEITAKKNVYVSPKAIQKLFQKAIVKFLFNLELQCITFMSEIDYPHDNSHGKFGINIMIIL